MCRSMCAHGGGLCRGICVHIVEDYMEEYVCN